MARKISRNRKIKENSDLIAGEKEDQKAEHNRTQYHDQESLPTGLVGSPSTQHVGYWNFRREAVLEVTSDASSVQACWWNSKK